jgi:polysaccharide pyruvyl transferase CsaB
MHKILLAGYYGLNNIGDEAILEKFIELLKEVSKDIEITVMSGKPDYTRKVYGVNSIDRKDFIKVNQSIFKSDVVIFGGGSLLQDVTSKRSIYYYLYIIMISVLMKKKVLLLSQGIGPVKSKTNRILISCLLNRVDFITVRDLNSMSELRRLKINDEIIGFSADPVIDFGTHLPKTISAKKKVGLSFRYWKDADVINPLIFIIKDLRNKGIDIVLIPFHYNEDIDLINEIGSKSEEQVCSIKEKMTPKELYNVISGLDLLIGSRLHSLIFAVSADVPVTAVSYDPKVEYFMKSIGDNPICDIKEMNTELILKDVYQKLESNIQYKDKKEILIKTINKNIEVIQKAIEG